MRSSARPLPLVAVGCLVMGSLLGGVLGGKVQAEAQRPEDDFWDFAQVLALVEDQYVGEQKPDELIESALEGLLRTLDPHSNFLNTESFTEMRDEQRGKFHGLGIQITKRGPDKPLTIIAPIDGTPAARAGLQSGDIISMIEGQPTIDLTVQEAVRLLKGDRGTKVTITVKRPGLEDTFDVTIERDEIPIESIRVTYLIRPTVGVIRIINFTNTTSDELDASLTQLKEDGMTGLILDLRGNPGGLLEQAVQVSSKFLPVGKRIVYTRGRIPESNQDFVVKRGGTHLDIPLVVLVDHSSASASEIVSGAIQDHDRGLVVGQTTFGKGLVQRVFPLRDGAALAVTTAKYYTPSGRLIQRDYSDLEEYYLNRSDPEEGDADADADANEEEEAQAEAQLEPPLSTREVFYTASGRKVYGGGGITPDYIVRTPKTAPLVFRLIRENTIFDYAVAFVGRHPDLQPTFKLEPATLDDFQAFASKRDLEFTPEEFQQARDEIGRRLRAQVARIKWDQIAEARVVAEADPQMQRALEVLDEAARLAERAAGGEPGRTPRANGDRATLTPPVRG